MSQCRPFPLLLKTKMFTRTDLLLLTPELTDKVEKKEKKTKNMEKGSKNIVRHLRP